MAVQSSGDGWTTAKRCPPALAGLAEALRGGEVPLRGCGRQLAPLVLQGVTELG